MFSHPTLFFSGVGWNLLEIKYRLTIHPKFIFFQIFIEMLDRLTREPLSCFYLGLKVRYYPELMGFARLRSSSRGLY